MIELEKDLQSRSSRGLLRRVTSADNDQDELTMISERIKNAVDGITVSYHCTRYSNYMLISSHLFQAREAVHTRVNMARALVGALLLKSSLWSHIDLVA